MPLTHDELVSIRDYIEFTERQLKTTEFSQSVLRMVNRELTTTKYPKEPKNGR